MNSKTISLFILIFFFNYIKAQNNEGYVDFDIVQIDTINGTSQNLPDSLYYRYSFTANTTCIHFGTTTYYEEQLVNEQGGYFINNKGENMTYAKTSGPISFDSLVYVGDTSEFKFILAHETKQIMGYNCSKIIVQNFTNDLNNSRTYIGGYNIWFTQDIKGNQYLPLFIGSFPSTNGLILEYEYPKENGYTKFVAKTVNLAAVSWNVFHPDLSGYKLLFNNE